ncbi:hypothetical protein S40285_10368 [Stachybotrys chlorohalonatus IBT 40285]|uniref:Uncharacterized protein n=1 Tax=Stachybotrys chlorohalonatus (strain IBT 40285) TaxID=1283841 RepID=A0A084QNY4_STAC4|nr:hypothetical protein S40285_10368 [Stachybotrys chlorohalonata IBT 40285]
MSWRVLFKAHGEYRWVQTVLSLQGCPSLTPYHMTCCSTPILECDSRKYKAGQRAPAALSFKLLRVALHSSKAAQFDVFSLFVRVCLEWSLAWARLGPPGVRYRAFTLCSQVYQPEPDSGRSKHDTQAQGGLKPQSRRAVNCDVATRLGLALDSEGPRPVMPLDPPLVHLVGHPPVALLSAPQEVPHS